MAQQSDAVRDQQKGRVDLTLVGGAGHVGLPLALSLTPTSEGAVDAAALFGMVAPDVIRVKPLEAAFAKLFSNAYGYIEFAATNQFLIIACSVGGDYNAILNAMKRNFPLGAPTMRLAAFARNQFALGHAATQINEGLVLYLVGELRRSRDLSQSTIGLLGMAFKTDTDDIRASLSYKLKCALLSHAKEVLTTDPLVTADPELLPIEQVIEQSDILILCTPHNAYRNSNLCGKPILDIWGFFEKSVNDL